MRIPSVISKITGLGKSTGADAETRQLYRHKAMRAAGVAVSLVKDKIAELKRERDAKWTEACRYLKTGQKPAARHALAEVRNIDIGMSQLDRKRWLFENLVIKIESIETDRSFASALSALAKVITVDPEQTADALVDAVAKCDAFKDVEKAWNREYARAENGAAVSADVPSVDDMLKDLENAVTHDKAEKSDKKKSDPPASEKKPAEKTTATNIAEILRNIAKAMDGSGK